MVLKTKLKLIVTILFFLSLHQNAIFSDQNTLKTFEERLSKCRTYDDYEKYVLDIKNIISENPNAEDTDGLYYIIAQTRVKELKFLTDKNDIESARIYIEVSDEYFNEALMYLNKALNITASKELVLEVYFLKFLIFKERFQSEKADELLDEIANRLTSYSDKPSVNNEKLALLADRLNKSGLVDYGLKLRIAYASKVDENSAKDVLEDVKISADEIFAQGNMKAADMLYDEYIKTGREYFPKDVLASKAMEIAQKYFTAGRYNNAMTYYEFYKELYPDSKDLDWCDYRISLCYYNEKDMAKAISHLTAFLDTYKNSSWFDKAFETLATLYYVNHSREDAITNLQRLTDNYYRKNSGDYARVLIGLLYYGDKKYDKALDELKKIEEMSMYSYSATMIIDDIAEIKKGAAPTFSIASKDTYKMWEPYSETNVMVIPFENDKKLEFTYVDGIGHLNTVRGAMIKFDIQLVKDLDKFGEYLQDREDVSRLPKKIGEKTEKDILSIEWTASGSGKFVDEKQSMTKLWQAPPDAGVYKVLLRIDDFGLVRSPDSGLRKDPAKELSVVIVVKE